MSEGVAAVERALSILDAFREGDCALPLAELARRTGLYKSTLLRLAASLERAGHLRRLEDGRFALGPALLRLGELYQASFSLEDHVLPVLRGLVDTTRESASLYVREGEQRVCLFRVNSLAHRVLHYVTPGTTLALNTGASGRILLAFTEPDGAGYALERTRLLAISAKDRKSETAALACPVFGVEGFVGSLSLAGPSNRFTTDAIATMSDALIAAARSLTHALGGAWPDTTEPAAE